MSNWMIREDQLDPDQRDFINIESRKKGNIWIQGFAGSGKSVLLLHKLREVLEKEPNASICIIVFTHSLIAMFEAGMKELNIKQDIPVMTYFQFKKSLYNGDYNQLNTYLDNYNIRMNYIGNGIGSLIDASENKKIILMTYHSSKGLDFDNAFLPMLDEENWGSFKNIFEFVNTQEDYVKNSKINGLDFYIITPLFLMLKDEMIKNNNDLSKTLLLDESKLERFKEYKDNFYYAIIIFSYFFGYKYIYDAYYDRLDLSIFRKEGDLKHFTNPVLEHKENFLEEGA